VEEVLLHAEQVFFPIVDTWFFAKTQPDKLVQWCADGDFCAIFASCISSEPRAAHFRPAF